MKPQALAVRYLQEQWSKKHKDIPPLDLTEAVIKSVLALGYTRALVDNLINQYEKNKAR